MSWVVGSLTRPICRLLYAFTNTSHDRNPFLTAIQTPVTLWASLPQSQSGVHRSFLFAQCGREGTVYRTHRRRGTDLLPFCAASRYSESRAKFGSQIWSQEHMNHPRTWTSMPARKSEVIQVSRGSYCLLQVDAAIMWCYPRPFTCERKQFHQVDW